MSDILYNEPFVLKCDVEDTSFKITFDSVFYSDGENYPKKYKNIHFHKDYELFFLTGGKIDLHLNNNEVSEFSDCIVIVPPFLKHYSVRKDGESYKFMLSFTPKKNKNGASGTYKFYKRLFGLSSVPFMSESVKQYCEQIRSYISMDKPDRFINEKIKLLLQLILYEFISRIPEKSKKTDFFEESYLLKIENTVFNHFNESITLPQLAKFLNLSTRQTSRILHNNYGKPLSELINDKKISASMEMLTETDMKMIEIAEQLNFNSESYFFRMFKKYTGCTPKEYREKHSDKT